jgi:hypothetical protein
MQAPSIQAYQLNKGGAFARLCILKMLAANSVRNANPSTRLAPGDWKGARRYTLGTYERAYSHGMCRGSNGKTPVWYCHGGEYLRNPRAHPAIFAVRIDA